MIDPVVQKTAKAEDADDSYREILKSTSLIGGAQGINMLVGIVRVKFVAIFIGPVGVGLVGMYQSAVQLIGTVAGLGLQTSAVRDIAEAVGAEDQERIGRTVLTLRRMCWLTGIVGSLAVALFSKQLSQVTFGSVDYASGVALAGITILFANLQGGQMALIQGQRRIADLARLSIYGTLSGSVISIGLYAWRGVDGIVPALVMLAINQLLASWWFARKIVVPKVQMSWAASFKAAGGMVKLGLALVWTGLLTTGVSYLTRILIVRDIDIMAVGIFSAAFALSGMVVNFVLGAMVADYYPSLTALSHDHPKMCDLVNRQTEIGLLLALPGLLAILALAPWIIHIFYSADFWEAADLLRWFALGCLGRVVSWPMGFVILAKGAGRTYALTETFTNVLHIGLVWGGLQLLGIKGTAIAFFTLYVFYALLMLAVSRVLIGFSWSQGVLKLFFVTSPVVGLTFIACKLLPDVLAFVFGLLITIVTSIYCLRGIIFRLGSGHKVCRLAQKIPLLNYFMPKLDKAF